MKSRAALFRRVVVALACAGSMAAGAWAVWHFAPRAFEQLTTLELGALIGLLVLPVLTVAAVISERRLRRAWAVPGADVRETVRRVVHEAGAGHRTSGLRPRAADAEPEALRPRPSVN
ncbi:MAG: hypothetical protein KIT68_03615 [Phycisphaeraceae bacterium]|nr:hypothetical protein [Phycisphaeraceae bacterium]